MANITLDELRAKYPPEDREEYDRAYAAATLAGQLAELVYALRTRAGLTQTELARRMGTPQSSIARIEGGGSLPTLDMLARLAHATGSPLRIAAPGVTDIDLGEALLLRDGRHGGRWACHAFGSSGTSGATQGRAHRHIADLHTHGRVVGSVSPWPTGQVLTRRRMARRPT